MKVATSILKKFLPLLSKWANNYEIEHGGKREYRNFIPPNFDDDAFDIIAFDPYSTKGLTIGDIESTSTEEIYRVKVYSEFSPNDSTEYKLKNLEKITIPYNANMQNKIIEFYAGNDTTPFEKVYLEPNKDNWKYGICLTKTNSTNYIYYLANETERKYNNILAWDLLNGGDWISTHNIDTMLEAMDPSDRYAYESLIVLKSKVVDKSEVTRTSLSEDTILSIWRDPQYLLRGNTMLIFGNNYYSNFTQNTEKILVDENGEEVPNLGLHFNENGKASYQIYIPKTGSYNLSYVFTHSDAVNLNVKNLNGGGTVYSIEADSTEDGQPRVKVSVPKEIEIEQGLLNIQVEGSNLDFNCMVLQYIGNKEEQRAEYLQAAYDLINAEVVSAIDLFDRKNTSKEDIQYALNSANFVKENIIQPKKQSLLDSGYSSADPLMNNIDNKIQELDNRIEQATVELANFKEEILVVIEGEDPYENNTSMTVDRAGGYGAFTSRDFDSGKWTVAKYKVTIPKAGYYMPYYFIINYNDNAYINVGDENGRTFDNFYVPKTCEYWDWKTEKVQGSREYLEAGETYIGVCCTINGFMLDKIHLVYEEADDVLIGGNGDDMLVFE